VRDVQSVADSGARREFRQYTARITQKSKQFGNNESREEVMIDYAALDRISDKLKAFRADSDLIHDARDQGNYHDDSAIKQFEMLKRSDKTGFAVGMMLNEMIEATIAHSTIRLSDLLRKEGFLEKMVRIRSLKQMVEALVGDATTNFQDRLEERIGKVSPDFGRPTTREIACCLRDAVHGLDRGLTIRWLRFDEVGSNAPVGIHDQVIICPTLADFTDQLKGQLPFGCYLAKIGDSFTAIGIKKPGRIVYLSSMSVSVHTGHMAQNGNPSMVEHLDLTTPGYRYPDWRTFKRVGDTYHVDGDSGILNLSDLKRDTLIWLAMVVELASQEMAKVEPGTIRLTESVRLALTNGEQIAKLPVLYRPNWSLHKPTLPQMMEALGFHEGWLSTFLAEAIEGLDADSFLPVGDESGYFMLETKTFMPLSEIKGTGYFQETEMLKRGARFTAVSPGIAGTEEEIDLAIKTIFGRNLANYLFKWGNERFKSLWLQDKEWFIKLVTKNAEKAIDMESTKIYPSDAQLHESGAGISSIYAQHPKRQGFSPLCFFDRKSTVDAIAVVSPQNAADLCKAMGLKSAAKLPAYLHEWTRFLGWSTGRTHSGNTPFDVSERWIWGNNEQEGNRGRDVFTVKIHFNTKNHALKTEFAR
jgi:hypothetical protein